MSGREWGLTGRELPSQGKVIAKKGTSSAHSSDDCARFSPPRKPTFPGVTYKRFLLVGASSYFRRPENHPVHQITFTLKRAHSARFGVRQFIAALPLREYFPASSSGGNADTRRQSRKTGTGSAQPSDDCTRFSPPRKPPVKSANTNYPLPEIFPL